MGLLIYLYARSLIPVKVFALLYSVMIELMTSGLGIEPMTSVLSKGRKHYQLCHLNPYDPSNNSPSAFLKH